eukprot:4861607-Ditylum_brightwellii.AAC.1
MQSSAKHVQWQNGTQNHQNGKPLLVLDPNVNGGASEKFPTMDVGDKIKSPIMKLQETHRKDKFLVFTEDGKINQLEAFPKKPVEIKSLIKYSVNNRWKNISL